MTWVRTRTSIVALSPPFTESVGDWLSLDQGCERRPDMKHSQVIVEFVVTVTSGS